MSNSPLATYTIISPNKTKRNKKISKITIHHMAGNLSIESCGNVFQPVERQASSNYGVGSDGRIGLYVPENYRAWTSSNRDNDEVAVTIEVANDSREPDWHVSDKALASLIDLCVDICERNDIEKLVYTGDATGNLTRHNMFAYTTCPGPYLQSKFPYIVEETNKRLGANKTEPQKVGSYRVQIDAVYTKEAAEDVVKKLKVAGFSSIIMEADNEAEQNHVWVPKVGDIVMFNGDKHYSSANSVTGYKCSKGRAKITQIYQLGKSKHPYHLKQLDGSGPHGWVDAGTFTKV